jgi:hypothetical protein
MTWISISFAQNICDNNNLAHICTGNLNISRSEMPQLTTYSFYKYVHDYKKIYNSMCIHPSILIPTQSDIYLNKILHLMNNLTFTCDNEKYEIYVMYPNYYIIDGHHRYAACRLMNHYMNVVVIYDDIYKVLNEINNSYNNTYIDNI